jgi:hypothetical protein
MEIEVGRMDSLNVAETIEAGAIPVASIEGDTEVTVGGVMSGLAVVNDQEVVAMTFPAMSFAPLRVAVYVVVGVRSVSGLRVTD